MTREEEITNELENGEHQAASLSYVDLAEAIGKLLKAGIITRDEITTAKIAAAKMFATELNAEVDAVTFPA
jgi:hypothetical protein